MPAMRRFYDLVKFKYNSNLQRLIYNRQFKIKATGIKTTEYVWPVGCAINNRITFLNNSLNDLLKVSILNI